MIIQFQKANEENIDEIFKIYQSAIKTMEKQSIFQWDEIYPDKDTLLNDIKCGNLYIGKSDYHIVSAYVINNQYDEEYNNASWKFPNSSFSVVHRLCVNPKFQKMGIGTKTMQHIEKYSKKQGITSIRLDAFIANQHAVKMYNKLGYQITGYANWRKGKFYLMEKLL